MKFNVAIPKHALNIIKQEFPHDNIIIFDKSLFEEYFPVDDNFNFNEDSDIDLHITTNFKKYNFDEDMLINFFNTKKTLYNQNHNITIYKHPVELYIEDSNNPAKSNGKYSLLKNKWLQIPQKIKV